MMNDNNLCLLCGHGLENHRIVKYTPTHLTVSCDFIDIGVKCICNGGFKTMVKIKLEETK